MVTTRSKICYYRAMKTAQQLPNDGLYITRKRKKYKFAHFDSYANCFSHERGGSGEETLAELREYLSGSPTVLEIAAGNAQFSLQLAMQYPEERFVAIDVKSDRLYTSAKKALEEGITNIAFLRCYLEWSKAKDFTQASQDDTAVLEQIFGKHAMKIIWLTFPDPHPKKRSAKHRLTHPSFLEQYRTILSETGELKFKTDNRELFLWSLEQFVVEKWHISELSFDLHESSLPDDYKIKTHYEETFTAKGIPTNYCTVMFDRKADTILDNSFVE